MLCRNNWFVKKSFQLLIFQVKDCYWIGQSVFCVEHNSISDRKNVQRKLEILNLLINIYNQFELSFTEMTRLIPIVSFIS